MRIISWVVALIVGIAIILFAVSNRQMVDIGLWPLDGTLAVRLYIAVLVCGLVAFLAGGVVSWLSAAPTRRLSRHRKRRIEDLERRLAQMEQRERTRADAAVAAQAAASAETAPPSRQLAAVRA
ncbi:putative NBD/HSP70 family sugar kinase [Constrictibacter sp. MBR-5]|jgi:predicted NBD/HSP70 family sugar kinase|uniref:lipopolysaccharide assembly protein LapA domain-containing protein n=1 Tax=Constrictibacter sp. MBR-5 TaxID=3156467 RepID=UPI00339A3E82